MSSPRHIAILVFMLLWQISVARAEKRIVVSKDGKGNFSSIQAAILSLPDSAKELTTIFVKAGVYKEKVYIEKHNFVLEGENRDKVIITAAIAREEWKCLHNDDWGVATVNIEANDITFKNLTVVNSYGFDWTANKTIPCATDTANKQKTVTRFSHQMAVRTMAATRFKAINCVFRSYAGDTMSPWNASGGLFYFKDCVMEGGVDLYCPRGWAYAENCKFVATRGDAIIWHDGSVYEDSKTVLKNCSFEGYDGFQLGRYHRDAQFYLVNCSFASNMADKPLYRVQTNNIIKWGHRVYYHNCHKTGGDYAWFADNLTSSSLSVRPDDITVEWVFGNKWSPVN
jgi:pectinesterase